MEARTRNISELGLWPHQHSAIASAQAYFESNTKKGCLIHMPTGTGKTGVIAVLASLRARSTPVLVVCPSAALVEQLESQLATGFWEKIAAHESWKPDAVYQLLPSNAATLVATITRDTNRSTIVVSTIQALQQIHVGGEGYAELRALIGTIVFDEGHREPAPVWADVVRSFDVPTVLFSATPFRNDLKIFNVDDGHIHFLSFSQAVNARLIRDVRIDSRNIPLDKQAFAREMVGIRDELVRNRHFSADNKMIVRAGSEEDVIELYQAFTEVLAGRTEGVLAIHHNFDSVGVPGMYPAVPTQLVNRPEKFLIHQYMLIEGIDDPTCTMLALYEPFSNTRMLVQQIGRLTRQPGAIGDDVSNAYVVVRAGDGVEDLWNSFLAYDRACVENGGKPPIRNDAQVLNNLVEALPRSDYVAGKFRNRIDFESTEWLEDLRFPRSALIYELDDPSLDMETLQSNISAALDTDDRFEQATGPANGGQFRYHVSLRLETSPFLSEYLFQTASLQVTIYVICGGRLFFYDSAGLWIDEIDGIGARVDPKALRSLLPAADGNVVSFISVKNTDLGPLAVRSRSLTARSLERSGVFMGEHLNVVTRAMGRVSDARRTVGFSNARVRDSERHGCTADEYAQWCESINRELDAAAPSAPILSRFATPTDAPADPTPANILVDMLELIGEFRTSEGRDVEITTENLCVDVVSDNDSKALAPFCFELVIDGSKVTVWISWHPKKRKYWLVSPALSKIKSKDNDKISLTKRLNRAQPFRIITADMQHVYVNGSFYALDLDLSDRRGAASLVLDLVTPLANLEKVTSEKGIIRGGSLPTWPEDSLFRFIDDALVHGRGDPALGPVFPALVCDDLGTEVGDFIGVDDGAETPRVVFLAAKWKSGDAGVSASAFYDVCAQGVKNIAYLKSDATPLPGAKRKYDDNWTLSTGKGRSKLTNKIARRRAGPGSAAFRTMLERIRAMPTTSRELWLVCAGGMLSKKALERELRSSPPKAHVLQFYHLVVSAFTACQSVGVELKIFCPE